MRKTAIKQDKPVNISISFNISPNEILKPQQPREKCSPGDIRGRKIRNQETLKSHRDTPLNTFFVPFSAAVTHRPEDLTERETFSRDDHEPRKKRKIKRQSMDGIFESRPGPEQLFISCENDKIFEKPQNAPTKFTPMMSTRRKPAMSKHRTSITKQPPTNVSTKSAKLQSTVLRSLMSKKEPEVNIQRLKQLISKLVTEELQRHQPKMQRIKATSRDIRPPVQPPKSQRRLKQRKKSMEFTRRINEKKRPSSKQSNRQVVVKLNSLKEMNDSELIHSEASDKEVLSSTVPLLPMAGMRDLHHPLPSNPTLKTSASQANLRQLVRVQYPGSEQPSREYSSVQEMMAIRIQRFWRQYRTKKLVKMYISLLRETDEGRNYLLNEMQYYRADGQQYYEDEELLQQQGMEEMHNMRHAMDPRLNNKQSDMPQQPRVTSFLEADRQDVSEIIEEYELQERMNEAQSQPNHTLKSPHKPTIAAVNNDGSDSKQIKQFHSFQLGRQEQPKDVAEFKRRELSKWDTTLEFINRNMDKPDMKDVLMQVMHQLELNKTTLEKEIGVNRKEQPDRTELASFTVALPSKQESSPSQSEYSELEKQIGDLGQSYISDEPNEELNLFNFKSIHSALNSRRKSLEIKRSKELQVLQNKLESGRIDQEVYDKERQRLNRWIKHEEAEIVRAKQHLERGLVKAKHIMEKNHGDNYFLKKISEHQQKSISSELKRCLSDNFIREAKLHNRTGKKQLRERVHTQSEESSEEQESRLKRSSEELSAKRLKEKLRDLSNNYAHQQGESPEISYESLSRQYNENSEEESEERNIIRNELKNLRDEEQPLAEVQGLLSGSLNRKMALLDESDKQDIFEFIFLDLCIEFCQEEIQEQKLQLVRQYIQRLRRPPPKKPRGIKTNLTIVKEYLKRFTSFVSRTSRQLMDRVCIPMGPSALEMLKYMHYSEEDAQDQEEDLVGALVLPGSTFEAFENSLLAGIEFDTYYDDPERQHNRTEFLKGVIHIHNKAIFDSLNESLDLERPFGIWGKPFPWKRVPEFAHQLSFERKEEKFKKATDRVVQNCTFVCGIIIDKEDSLVNPGARLSEQYVEQIREDRLSRMLAADLIESEERFVFYDDEQTEVLVEISQLAYQLLLREAVRELLAVRDRLL